MEAEEAIRLKAPEDENARWKRLQANNAPRVESFSKRFRDKCLVRQRFRTLEDATVRTE